MELYNLIQYVKTQIYYILINIIMFMNMLMPFVSVKVLTDDSVEDNSYSFALKYLLGCALFYNSEKMKYQVHLKTLDKIFILYTSESELIQKHHTICETSEKFNPPRSLFVKYDVIVNGCELTIDQKILFKKYSEGTNICDMLEFNGIKLLDLKVIKNGSQFKIWDSNSENLKELKIEEIYPYL